MAAAARADGSWADVVGEGRLPRFVLICLGVWISAADSMVTATIMPSVGADLGGYAYFGWATAGFLLGSVLAGASSALAGVFARTVVTPVRRHAESTPILAVVDTPAGQDVILQADDGSTLSLSPGQTLPDGRRLVRLLPEVAEFELDGRRSALALPARDSAHDDALRPTTPVADGGPRRDHR